MVLIPSLARLGQASAAGWPPRKTWSLTWWKLGMPGTETMLDTAPGAVTWAGDAGRERASAREASPQRCSWMLMGLLFWVTKKVRRITFQIRCQCVTP